MLSDRPNPRDPLAQVVALLRPGASVSKLVLASGAWEICRIRDGRPFYCAVLEGAAMLRIAGREPAMLGAGDFALIPEAVDFSTSSVAPPPPGVDPEHAELGPGVFRLGPDAPPDARLLVGHFAFGSDDAGLLVSLLPALVHVRGRRRLTTLVELVDEEVRGDRPGREVVLERLLEVLLIEALRSAACRAAPPGLLRGLADPRLAAALRRMHDRPDRAWTVAALAREAALSRSVFFDRFRGEVGVPPMAYLAGWRMALARRMLREPGAGVAQVAARLGYGSTAPSAPPFRATPGCPPRVGRAAERPANRAFRRASAARCQADVRPSSWVA